MPRFRIGGREREFKFGWKAIRAAERQTGLGYGEIFVAIESDMRVGLVADLVWAGLLHAEPNLTIDQVEEWLDDVDDLPGLMELVNEHAAEALAIEDETEKKRSGTGPAPSREASPPTSTGAQPQPKLASS